MGTPDSATHNLDRERKPTGDVPVPPDKVPSGTPREGSGTPSKSQESHNLTKIEPSVSRSHHSQTRQDLENSDNNPTPDKGSEVCKAPAATGNAPQGHAPTTVVDSQHLNNVPGYNIKGVSVKKLGDKLEVKLGQMHGNVPSRRLAHLDEYQHSSPVPLALFLMMFFIVGMVVLRFTRSNAEPKKRSRKAKTMKTEERNSHSL